MVNLKDHSNYLAIVIRKSEIELLGVSPKNGTVTQQDNSDITQCFGLHNH